MRVAEGALNEPLRWSYEGCRGCVECAVERDKIGT